MPRRRSATRVEAVDVLGKVLPPMKTIKAITALERVTLLGSKRAACESLKITYHTLEGYLRHATTLAKELTHE